jgi:hypothetical protein
MLSWALCPSLDYLLEPYYLNTEVLVNHMENKSPLNKDLSFKIIEFAIIVINN